MLLDGAAGSDVEKPDATEWHAKPKSLRILGISTSPMASGMGASAVLGNVNVRTGRLHGDRAEGIRANAASWPDSTALGERRRPA